MNPTFTFLGKEPTLWTEAVRAVLFMLILLNVINLDEKQTAGIGLAISAVLALVARQSVTSNVSVRSRKKES